ncbi:hypothetical protein MMC30_003561 [Trapelia coarctata]|nr:hypothetical protein [Trapelia coarctata]
MSDKVANFIQHLSLIRAELEAELANYQSYSTSQDEFARIFECLGSLDEIRSFLTRRAGTVAVFFPLNLPIYSLTLYGIIPALIADQVFIRAPQRMAPLMRQLVPLLDIQSFFPNIQIVFEGREEFVREHVVSADVTIFTGKLENAQRVMAQTRSNSLFLFNGWGCNPIVLGEDADLRTATTKVVDARLFSSGQDCAGPDTILVHRNQATRFTTMLTERLKHTKVGVYHDPRVRVGRLADNDQTRLISSLLLKFQDHIAYGGTIDYQKATIHPTVIVVPLSERCNYEELFSPVFFVNVYDSDSQLGTYFEHPQYITNDMYVSLFGSSAYVDSLKRSIVVRDQVVFDVDRGNDAFGGYSIGASFVGKHKKITPKPILVPRDIFEFLDERILNRQLTPGNQKKVCKRVWEAVDRFFGDNLAFGFVYGSFASGTATRDSDINSMIVLKQEDAFQTEQYKRWLGDYHGLMELAVREACPAVVVSRQALDQAITEIETHASLEFFSGELEAEHSLWIEALSGTQRGVAGDKIEAVNYGKRVRKYSRDGKARGDDSRVMLKRNFSTVPQPPVDTALP